MQSNDSLYHRQNQHVALYLHTHCIFFCINCGGRQRFHDFCLTRPALNGYVHATWLVPSKSSSNIPHDEILSAKHPPRPPLQPSRVRSHAKKAEALGSSRSGLYSSDIYSRYTHQRQRWRGGGVQQKCVLTAQLLLLLYHRAVNDVDMVCIDPHSPPNLAHSTCSNIVRGPWYYKPFPFFTAAFKRAHGFYNISRHSILSSSHSLCCLSLLFLEHKNLDLHTPAILAQLWLDTLSWHSFWCSLPSQDSIWAPIFTFYLH